MASMNTTSPAAIYDKLSKLEREVQRLKIETYRALPSRAKQTLYPVKDIQAALGETRDAIWRKRYAKNVARIS